MEITAILLTPAQISIPGRIDYGGRDQETPLPSEGASGGKPLLEATFGGSGDSVCMPTGGHSCGDHQAACTAVLFLLLGSDGCLQQAKCEQNHREDTVLSPMRESVEGWTMPEEGREKGPVQGL